MTIDTSRPSERSRTVQDDLLADLRDAAPMPAARMPAPRSVVARTLSASLPVLAVAPAPVPSPVIELRLTRQPWSMPSLRQRPGAPGIELSAGPVLLSLSFLPG